MRYFTLRGTCVRVCSALGRVARSAEAGIVGRGDTVAIGDFF